MRVNPQTGQLEDDNGNPLGPAAVPMDQAQAAGPPVGMGLAANQRAGRDLSMPLVLDRGGNDGPPIGLPEQTPAATPVPIAPTPTPGMVRDTSTTSRTREVASAEERRAMKQTMATDQEAVRLAGEQGKVGEAQAQQQLEATQVQAALRQQQAQETQARVEAGQAEAAAAKAQFDGERAKLAGMDVKDFWADKGVGARVVAAIGLAMGAVGGALTGKGGNAAMDALDKTIDDDYRLQRAHIEIQRGRMGDAEKNLHLTNDERARRLSELEVSQTAKWLGVGDAARVKAAQVGTQAAAVQAQVIQNGAQQKAQAHYQQWLEGMRDKVTTTNTSMAGTGAGAGKPPTADQLKAAGFAERMQHQLQALGQLGPLGEQDKNTIMRDASIEELYNKHPGAKVIGQQVPGFYKTLEEKLTPEGRAYYQGMREFINANLRRESGAAISAQEWSDAMSRYGQVRGEGAQDRARKAAAMQDQYRATLREAGPAAALIGGGQAAPAAGAAAPRPAVSADDQAAIQWAHAHPKDPRARQILQMHGM